MYIQNNTRGTQKMLKDYIIKNNGATINKFGKITQLKTGYQVSKRDLGRITIDDFTEQMIQDIISYGLKRGEYAGFWIENGFIYVDISIRIATKKQAIIQGNILSQIAIWDWHNNQNIYCNK